MDLHDHPHLQIVLCNPPIHGQHSQLDEISGGALHGCVDRSPFSGLSTRMITRPHIVQVQPATKYGLNKSLFPRSHSSVFHECMHTRVTGEIEVDVILGFYTTDSQLLTQAKR